MSATTSANDNNNTSISEIDDVNMCQAARRNGRRNALGDLGEQLIQGKSIVDSTKLHLFSLVNTSITSAEIDQMTPNFQSMSIKQ
jgi:hypothetical protein